MLISDGGLIFQVHPEALDLIRTKIQSRFSNSVQHYVWVQFEAKSGRKKGKITGWFCQCKSGARTVGCCAHVTTVIWYLGHARHDEYDPNHPSDEDWNVIDCKKDDRYEDSDDEIES